MTSATPTGTGSQSGFSLIEMLAALAVVAIAGLALLNMTQATTRNTGAVQDRALAMLAAENLMNMRILDAATPRSTDGAYALGGVTYDWSLDVSATDDADLVRLHLVLREDGSQQVLAELDTFRRPRG